MGEALWWVSLRGFKQFGTSWAPRGRAGSRRVAHWEPSSGSGVGAQVGQSWKIAPKRALLQSVFLLRDDFGPTAKQGFALRAWWLPMAPSHHSLSLGRWLSALLRCYSMFIGEVSEIAAAAPGTLRALHCPSQLPTPPPRTRGPSSPGPTQFGTTGLSLTCCWRPPRSPSSCPTLVLPLRVPRSRKLPSPFRAAEPGVCSAPPSGTGGSGGGGRN